MSNNRRSIAGMCCFWNHGECLLPLSSVLSWRSCTTQTIERFILVKAQNQNKMHTNVSLLLIYKHWWTLLVLMERKKIYMRVDSTSEMLNRSSTTRLSKHMREICKFLYLFTPVKNLGTDYIVLSIFICILT